MTSRDDVVVELEAHLFISSQLEMLLRLTDSVMMEKEVTEVDDMFGVSVIELALCAWPQMSELGRHCSGVVTNTTTHLN